MWIVRKRGVDEARHLSMRRSLEAGQALVAGVDLPKVARELRGAVGLAQAEILASDRLILEVLAGLKGEVSGFEFGGKGARGIECGLKSPLSRFHFEEVAADHQQGVAVPQHDRSAVGFEADVIIEPGFAAGQEQVVGIRGRGKAKRVGEVAPDDLFKIR